MKTEYRNDPRFIHRLNKRTSNSLCKGMAIVAGKKSDIGYFEYKCGAGPWTEVNVTNKKPLGKKSDVINVVYLKGINPQLSTYYLIFTCFKNDDTLV